jgi:hypothetical protein
MTDSTGGSAPARQHLILCVAAILVAVALFIPRPTNFAPLGAFGMFVGVHAQVRYAWAYPLAVLATYVIAVGGYEWFVLGTVFLGFAGPAFIGSRWLRSRVTVGRVGAATLVTSLWFFLSSNLGSWVVFGAPRGESLVAHYLAGLPLFRNTVAGDLFFSTVLFGGHALVGASQRRDVPDPVQA